MHIFDYSFLKRDIPSDIVSASNIIYDLRGRNAIRSEAHRKLFDKLRKSAIVDSVRSSNAIEGIVSTRKRVQEIINDAQPKTHDEKEIAGYRDVLNEIYEEHDPELSEKLIKHWHRMMLAGTSSDAGKYKTEDNWIQQRDPEGTISIRFVPTKAKDTEKAMNQLLMAYHEGRQDSGISELFLDFAFVLDFLCIHPFTDGNGRISRLITDLLMVKSSFRAGLFISIEKKIDEHRAEYYDALRESSEGWHDNRNDYAPFILYMLRILYECYKELDERFIKGSSEKRSKTDKIRIFLENAYVPVSKQDILETFPEISETTVTRVIGDLIKEHKLEKIGSYRDARYRAL